MRTLWPLVLVSVTVLFIHINVACALQNITVDNTDHTMISYSGIWDETVQNSLDYNNSHSLSRELSATATFIFTGVAVYYMSPLWPYSVTTQLTLDGSTRVTLDLSGPGTDVNGEETVRSAVVWGVSELMDMQHTLVVSMAPNGMWIEVDAFIYTISTAPQQSPTTLASASNQQNPPTVTSISRPNGSVFEPVVGGVFGGIAIIIVLAIALCCWQGRRRNQHQTVDLEEEVNVSVASPGGNTESFPQRQPILPNILPSSSELASSHISAAQSPYPANLAPLTPTPLEFPVLSSAPQVSSIEDAISLQEHSIQLQHFVERNASAIIPAANLVSTAQFAGTPSSSVSAPLVSLSQTQQLSERSPDISGPASGVIPIVDTSEITTSLTADQAQFINRLYILNVPADEIARVMEAMRLERAEGAGECPSSGPSRIQSLWSQEAPPSYSIMDIQLTTS